MEQSILKTETNRIEFKEMLTDDLEQVRRSNNNCVYNTLVIYKRFNLYNAFISELTYIF